MSRSRLDERGVALVAVLWLLALVAAVAVGFATTTRTEVGLVRNLVDNARLRHIADAGVSAAVALLLDPRQAAAFCADGRGFTFRFEGEAVHVRLQDEGGKIDLNEAPAPLLRGLFVAVGETPERAASLAAALVDWRDADDRTEPGGAEAQAYVAASRSSGPKNAPFEAIEELAAVLGISAELYARLRPHVTVHSHIGGVDPAFATPVALAAVPGFSLELVQDYLRARAQGPACATPPPPSAAALPFMAGSPRLAFGVTVDVKTRDGAAFRREAVIGVGTGSEHPFLRLAWRTGMSAE